jgi:hypothetical protein
LGASDSIVVPRMPEAAISIVARPRASAVRIASTSAARWARARVSFGGSTRTISMPPKVEPSVAVERAARTTRRSPAATGIGRAKTARTIAVVSAKAGSRSTTSRASTTSVPACTRKRARGDHRAGAFAKRSTPSIARASESEPGAESCAPRATSPRSTPASAIATRAAEVTCVCAAPCT